MASVASNGVGNGVSAHNPTTNLTTLQPVTIDHELLDAIQLAKKAVEAKVKLQPGADVAVNQVTKRVQAPHTGEHYDVIMYVYEKEKRVFYEAAVSVDVKGTKKVESLNELPHTYLLKAQEKLFEASKQPILAKVEAFAVKELNKQLPLFSRGLEQLVLVENQLGPLTHDDLPIDVTWTLTYQIGTPFIGFAPPPEDVVVVIVEDAKTSKLRLVSIKPKEPASEHKQLGAQGNDGGYQPVQITNPLDPALDKAVLFAVNSILADKKATKEGTLVKIESAQKQLVNGTNWQLVLTLSLAPRQEDQTFQAMVYEALDHTFKLTNYKPAPPLGIDHVTSKYYLSYFANAAIHFSIPYISKQEKESVELLKVLNVLAIYGPIITGRPNDPYWSLTLVVGHGGGRPPITGVAEVVFDERAAPLPFKFVSWQHVKGNSELESHQSQNGHGGGYMPVDPKLPPVLDAARFAAKELPTLIPSLPQPIQLLRVVAAELQIVAGRNWRLVIEVATGAVITASEFKVVVYENLGNPGNKYELKSAVPANSGKVGAY